MGDRKSEIGNRSGVRLPISDFQSPIPGDTMHPVSPDTVLAQFRWRYATKKFDPARKIAPELWAKLEQAPLLAPSSYGLQPWKFVVVTDPEMRKKLHPVSYN